MYSIHEAEYLDRMSAYLLGRIRPGPRRFISSEVGELYMSLRPYASCRSRADLQKSAKSLIELHSIALATHDGEAYRQAGEDDGRVFLSASSERVHPEATFRDCQLQCRMRSLRWKCTLCLPTR